MFLVALAYLIPITALLSIVLILMQGGDKSDTTRVFKYFVGLLAVWLSFQWITDQFNQPSISLYTLRIAVAIGSFVPVMLFVFSQHFTQNYSRKLTQLLSSVATVFAVISFTPLMIPSVSKGALGISIRDSTIAYSLQTIFTAVIVVFSFFWLRVKIKKGADPALKVQARLITYGIASAVSLGIIGGYYLGNNGSNLLLPIAVALFATSIFITVFRHGLFDIRAIVARSLAYILSLVAIAVVFIGVAYALTDVILTNNQLGPNGTRWIYTILAVLLALVFPPLKKFFDKTTTSLFFRDAYDSQVLLENFNKVLVTTYDTAPLLKKSSEVILQYLKPQYAAFGIKATETTAQRIVGTANHPKFTDKDIAYVRSLTPKMRRKIIITDLLEPQYADLQRILRANNIAILARLAASVKEEGVGYLILGNKKTGNSYSSQDIKIIEILANELVIAIQNATHTEEIENFNITLQAKVDDATRKLRRTNEKLKQMDETKDDFISMASHQLRTPLTSVKGYISMVLEEDAGKITTMQREMLGQAFFSSQRMVYLIADLLNVSRLKTGKFIIERAPIHLDQIVQQELRQLQETAAARSLTLQFDKPDVFPVMMLDETKTRQIIMNFIDNAIYYTPAGGHIKVRLINNEHSVELRVEDNGIGVPKHEQQHLFTKFYRAGNARQARPDGTGLGLYMAKKVIVAQGGSLLFESEEGKGSAFGFVFSKSLAVASDPLAPVAEIPLQPVAEPSKQLTSVK